MTMIIVIFINFIKFIMIHDQDHLDLHCHRPAPSQAPQVHHHHHQYYCPAIVHEVLVDAMRS